MIRYMRPGGSGRRILVRCVWMGRGPDALEEVRVEEMEEVNNPSTTGDSSELGSLIFEAHR
jgi:hypothetical protein